MPPPTDTVHSTTEFFHLSIYAHLTPFDVTLLLLAGAVVAIKILFTGKAFIQIVSLLSFSRNPPLPSGKDSHIIQFFLNESVRQSR